MKFRWLITVVLFLHFADICSQNNSPGLFLKYHGWSVNDPYFEIFAKENLPEEQMSKEQMMAFIGYYLQNKQSILDKADLDVLYSLYCDPLKKTMSKQEFWSMIGQGVVAGVASYQEQEAQRQQMEAQRKAQLQEQHNRNMEIAMQNRAKQAEQLNAMQNSSYTTTSSTPLYSSQQTQKSNSNMTTSDMNSYMAIQMSNAAYGTQATQEALNQQAQNNYNNSKNGGYGGEVIQAVMSNGKAIKIQVRGDRVVAYSTGVQARTQNWAPANGGIFRTTGVGNSLEIEYSHKTSFFIGNSNVTVYFNL